MRKAIAFSWRRRARSESSPFANVLVGKLRQIAKGELRPASEVVSHSDRHILLGVMEAGKYESWRKFMMTILDLFIELQMSVIMKSGIILIIEDVGLGRGFTQDLMFIKVKQQGGLF